MRIAFLGTGTVPAKLATAWAAAGHDIVLGSRTPDGKEAAFPVTTHAEAVANADVVVDAVPGAAAVETLRALGDALSGKVVIDLANAIGPDRGLMYPATSLGEEIQAAVPGARVVKTMNTAYIGLIAKPGSYDDPGSLFLSGNDADAKATVTSLLQDLGWGEDRIVDLGGIETARGAEHYFLLFMNLLASTGSSRFNIRVVGL